MLISRNLVFVDNSEDTKLQRRLDDQIPILIRGVYIRVGNARGLFAAWLPAFLWMKKLFT